MTTKSNNTVNLVCREPGFIKSRLDKYLFFKYPEFSRAYFQDLIDNGHVKVNEKTINKSSYLLRDGDSIIINFIQQDAFDLTPCKVDFEIIDETSDFLVINKPAGLTVHQSDHNKDEVTLVNGLLYHFQDIGKSFSDSDNRPGIIHRLDKNTSGLMLVARNTRAQIEFSNMFKNRLVHKTYLAVVRGITKQDGKIDFAIGRHPIERHKMSHLGIDSRDALTFFKTIYRYKNASLVAARIIKGRTHQIRVHFAAIGHGLLGDGTYGIQTPIIQRQALHAWKINFEFKGKTYNYHKHVPSDIANLLKTLNQG